MHAICASHAELNGVYDGWKCQDTDTLGFDEDGSGEDMSMSMKQVLFLVF